MIFFALAEKNVILMQNKPILNIMLHKFYRKDASKKIFFDDLIFFPA